MTKALLLIDLQNDYFEDGKFPLWNTSKVLDNIKQLILKLQKQGVPVIHVQHIADSSHGIAPFFNEGTKGVEIHCDVLSLVEEKNVVIKHYADSFHETTLESQLKKHNVTELIISGMMTQNCVTHTAISKAAEKYDNVTVLTDCSSTVSEILHLIALNALSTRVSLKSFKDAL